MPYISKNYFNHQKLKKVLALVQCKYKHSSWCFLSDHQMPRTGHLRALEYLEQQESPIFASMNLFRLLHTVYRFRSSLILACIPMRPKMLDFAFLLYLLSQYKSKSCCCQNKRRLKLCITAGVQII